MLLEMSDDDEVDSVSVVCCDNGDDDRGRRDGTHERGVRCFCGVVVRIVVVVGCLRGCCSVRIVGCSISSSDCRSGGGDPGTQPITVFSWCDLFWCWSHSAQL